MSTPPLQISWDDKKAQANAAKHYGKATLLKRDAVGVNDDFFDLGGHSLLVIKLVASIRKQLGIEMPPASVFDHSTPSALALAVRSVSDDADQLEFRAAGFAMEQPA